MKNTIKFLISTALLCFISNITIANEGATFSVNVAEKNMINLQFSDANKSQIEVTIIDVFGIILLDEVLTQKKVNHRKYDLNNLPIGDYTLVVAYDDVIKIQTIKKDIDSIEIESDKVQTIYEPTIRQHDKYVDLNMASNANQKVYLEIRDFEGHVIYSDHNQSTGSLEKRFNLENLESGQYTFALGMIGIGINKEFAKTIKWSPIETK